MKPKILFILHLPPPVHGSSIVGGFIKASTLINNRFNSKYINLGTSKSVDAIGKKFAQLCKKYKIKDAVPHDLRHNSLSDFMRVKNLNVPETMLIAGHKDPRMLLRIYNNLQVEHVAEKLDKS